MQRVLCRFAIVYVVLALVPVTWSFVVPWVAQGVLGLSPPPFRGSGDTTWNYVHVGVDAALAVTVAGVWTALRPRGRALIPTLSLLVRAYLFKVLTAYGLMKVFKTQFPEPSLVRLTTPYGETSPMGLLWTFMGSSTSYCVFTGALELVGGLLLVSRRTATVGALVLVGVMANVVVLNFAYDVPVKQHALHLLAGAGFLLARDGRRIVDCLVLGRSVPARSPEQIFEGPRLRWVGRVATAMFFTSVLISNIANVVRMKRRLVDAARPPLYGIWEVERFERNGIVVPPLATDETYWRRLIVAARGRASLETMTGRRTSHRATADEDSRRLVLDPHDEGVEYDLAYDQLERERLVLTGALDGGTVRVELRRAHDTPFLLTTHGFQWVSPQPLNPWR